MNTIKITEFKKNPVKNRDRVSMSEFIVSCKQFQFSLSLCINSYKQNSLEWILTSLIFESVICPCLLIKLISLSFMLGGNDLISAAYLERFFVKLRRHLK